MIDEAPDLVRYLAQRVGIPNLFHLATLRGRHLKHRFRGFGMTVEIPGDAVHQDCWMTHPWHVLLSSPYLQGLLHCFH